MNLPGPDSRILEVHPVPFTRLLYRYPSSGHWEWDHLGVPLLQASVKDAATLGYTTLHIAGEEPLHCPALHPLCSEAHRSGMNTTLQLRQTQLNRRLLEELQGSVDLLGVVLEKKPAADGRVRPCPQIRKARELGIAVEVIVSLTRNNMDDLEWSAQFAIEHDACALSIRPRRLSEDQLATAWMIVELLRDLCRSRLQVGFDRPNRHCLPIQISELSEWHRRLIAEAHSLSEVVSPLVIQSDGTVVPLRNGFPLKFALGDLRSRPLPELADFWISNRCAGFIRCYRDVLSRVYTNGGAFSDFFDLLSEEAGRSCGAALANAG